ncbi:MAG TPA: 3'-5' exonuclease [Acidobacteriota bacterium]|nr:3'-5' exonuclease [Acidobacteriota bacterium]
MAHFLVFDIETRVDKELVKQIYDPENTLTVDQAYDKARDKLLEKSGQQSDFFPIPFHIPIAIATLQADENYRIRGLGCLGADRFSEVDLVTRFWQMFDGCRTLVTFNGRGFDLPVLETRALKYGIPLPRYFGRGDSKNSYRGNRYSDAYHIDLCDFLSNFGAVYRRGSLDLLAKLIGLPGKYTIAGEDVEYLYRQGRQKEINQYCITDVLQTYLLLLKVELLRGRLDSACYDAAAAAAREDLQQRASSAGGENFLTDFLQRWK